MVVEEGGVGRGLGMGATGSLAVESRNQYKVVGGRGTQYKVKWWQA